MSTDPVKQRDAINIIGRHASRSMEIVPLAFERAEDIVIVASTGTDAEREHVRRRLQRMTDHSIRLVAWEHDRIQSELDRIFPFVAHASAQSEARALYEEVLYFANGLHASNVFLEWNDSVGRIRVDAHGELQKFRPDQPDISSDVHEQLIYFIASQAFGTFNKNIGQRGKISTTVDDRRLTIRVSSFPVDHLTAETRAKLALRLLRHTSVIPSPQKLGMEPRTLAFFRDALTSARSTLIIAAPPGHGKTTSFSCVLTLLDLDGENVYTIEDPVEYHNHLLTQTPIHEDLEWTFGAALKQILTQTPRYVFVGECLDSDTATRTMHAGQAGIPLGTTLHADDIMIVPSRLRSLGVSGLVQAQALTHLASQRLVRALCQHCSFKNQKPSDVFLQHLSRLRLKAPDNIKVQKRNPEGCDECRNRGTRGRIAVFETLTVTPELRRAIRAEDDDAIMKAARAGGYITLIEEAVRAVLLGTIDEADLVGMPKTDASVLPRMNPLYDEDYATALAAAQRGTSPVQLAV